MDTEPESDHEDNSERSSLIVALLLLIPFVLLLLWGIFSNTK